jgi:hypothetical protein
MPVQEIFVLPWLALVSPVPTVQNIFSSPHIISLQLYPSPIKLGMESCRVTCHLKCDSVCALADLVQYKNLQIFFSLSGFRAFGAERPDRPRERAGESEQKERLAQAADRKINHTSSRYVDKFVLQLLFFKLALAAICVAKNQTSFICL